MQYVIFNKPFRRIYGRKDKNSFIDYTKAYEYIVNSCITYGRVKTPLNGCLQYVSYWMI